MCDSGNRKLTGVFVTFSLSVCYYHDAVMNLLLQVVLPAFPVDSSEWTPRSRAPGSLQCLPASPEVAAQMLSNLPVEKSLLLWPAATGPARNEPDLCNNHANTKRLLSMGTKAYKNKENTRAFVLLILSSLTWQHRWGSRDVLKYKTRKGCSSAPEIETHLWYLPDEPLQCWTGSSPWGKAGPQVPTYDLIREATMCVNRQGRCYSIWFI